MGDWFRAGGYDTYYKGKWHVSDADLYLPGSHKTFPSDTSDGIRDTDLEEIHLEAGMLEGFGFTGWIGPEPHGSNVPTDLFDEVPFVVHNPELFPSGTSTDVLTSHVDLLPLMLRLAGLDQSVLIPQLSETHSQVQALPGRDLSAFLPGLETESVVANLPTGTLGQMERWKYTRYFDNPDFWSSPDTRDSVTIIDGVMQLPGAHKNAVTTLKTQALPDQIEIYNTSADPLELVNIGSDSVLMATPRIAGIVQQLQTLLAEQVALKRLEPTGQTSVSSAPGLFRFGSGPDFSAVSDSAETEGAEAVPVFTG